jgi:hypothetical protein
LYGDLWGGAFNVTEVVHCKFDCCRSEVFFEPMQLSRTWDRNNPGFPGMPWNQDVFPKLAQVPFADHWWTQEYEHAAKVANEAINEAVARYLHEAMLEKEEQQEGG